MTQPNRKRQRRTFTLDDRAYEQLTRLAETEDGNRSRYLEGLITRAHELSSHRTFTLGDDAHEQQSYIAESDGTCKSVALELAIQRWAQIRVEYERLERERRQVNQARDRLREWARRPRPPWWKLWARPPALPDLPELADQPPTVDAEEGEPTV